MIDRPLYQHLAALGRAWKHAQSTGNVEWEREHATRAQALASNLLPHGSGFDSGTTIELDRCKLNRVVLHTSFHHMHESGMYDRWTEHDVIITPDLAYGFSLRIMGTDYEGIKEYMYETFDAALHTKVQTDGGGVFHAGEREIIA